MLLSHHPNIISVCSSTTRNQRQFSGLLAATLSGFLTFTYLEPVFVPQGDTAMVFLYLLVINAIMVGMCLGVLLPTLIAGLSWGCAVTLLVGAFLSATVQYTYYFPLVGGVLGILAALASFR